MNELRQKVARIIHKETTQVPQKFPHECDFQAADEALAEVANFIREEMLDCSPGYIAEVICKL